MRKSYRGPSMDASCKILLYLAKWFQRSRYLENRPTRNKNCLWWPCLLVDWDKISHLSRGPSMNASYQVSVHLDMWFQRRFFLNWRTRNKNCLSLSCLLTDSNDIGNLYRGPSIDASYQVSIHLAKQFQRRRFLEIDQLETSIVYGGHVC